MKNQVYTGTPTSRRQVVLPSTILAGDPILVGILPGVCLDNYQTNVAGATVLFNGSFTLSVTAKSSFSPSVGAALKVGDKVYADGGTLDTATNVRYGFTLDANSSTGILFGEIDASGAAILASATDTAATVKLAGTGS